MTSTLHISSSARGNQRAVLLELALLATQVTEHSQLTNYIHKTLQSMQATLIEQQQVIETLKKQQVPETSSWKIQSTCATQASGKPIYTLLITLTIKLVSKTITRY